MQVVIRGNDSQTVEAHRVWFIVVQGRVDMCVRTSAVGRTYRMCGFREGDTFAASYIKMFQTSDGIETHVEASSDATCIVVTIPDSFKGEFKTCTRPLWCVLHMCVCVLVCVAETRNRLLWCVLHVCVCVYGQGVH